MLGDRMFGNQATDARKKMEGSALSESSKLRRSSRLKKKKIAV